MATTDAQPYSTLEVRDPVNAKRAGPFALNRPNLKIFILMGPTGTGKSSFIESLSSTGNLSISEDSLDSVTQTVQPYTVENVTKNGWDIILLDTPGFLDVGMSESRVCHKIKEWFSFLYIKSTYLYVQILYFQDITAVRMTRGKEDALTLLSAWKSGFSGGGSVALTVVSTMWNRLDRDAARRKAESKFEELEQYWKPHTGSTIQKFDGSQKSALDILDGPFSKSVRFMPVPVTMTENRERYRDARTLNINERIANVEMELRDIIMELQQPREGGKEDRRLRLILVDKKWKARRYLRELKKDLSDIKSEGRYPALSHPLGGFGLDIRCLDLLLDRTMANPDFDPDHDPPPQPSAYSFFFWPLGTVHALFSYVNACF